MKIGTDALLLGAWTPVAPDMRVLDIGTGSGILLLMLAQRAQGTGSFLGIELDDRAFEQAKINLLRSPFEAKVIQADALQWMQRPTEAPFDLVVCNPPFFRNKPLSKDQSRNLARHDAHLPIEKMLPLVVSILNTEGLFSMVWPTDRKEELLLVAKNAGLVCTKQVDIQGHPEASIRRHLFAFRHAAILSPNPREKERSKLVIEKGPRNPGEPPKYSKHYKDLLQDFFSQLA
ncbi:MAG: tRNA1(Val) (adenine(37)-N6)-methyltransferase [Flavobacteriales bacterium]